MTNELTLPGALQMSGIMDGLTGAKEMLQLEHNKISELFEISNSENEISEIEYNTLVSDIYTDIDNMKTNNVGQCRLDFIK